MTAAVCASFRWVVCGSHRADGAEKLADRALFILQQAARVIDIVVAATGRLLYLMAHG
jgi:hypothetical protein